MIDKITVFPKHSGQKTYRAQRIILDTDTIQGEKKVENQTLFNHYVD